MPGAELDHRTAFHLAPVGLALSRQRWIVDCNQHLLDMFLATREQLIGHSFEVLYPTTDEFERTGVRIAAHLESSDRYVDERVMKRSNGELFWCRVSGRALDPENPHLAGIWCFEDPWPQRKLSVDLTPREREVAALLVQGLTSKLIGKRLGISHRTVDIFRARLMEKHGARSTPELVQKLLRAPPL